MEKIFSFLKKNIVFILIVIIVIMLCKPKKVKEKFSSPTSLNNDNLKLVTVADAHKSLPLKDVACESKCTNGECNLGIKNDMVAYLCSTNNESFAYLKCEGNGDNRKCYKEKNSDGLCSKGIGGKVYSEFTKKACLSLNDNNQEYKNQDFIMDNKLKEELVWKKGTNKNQFYTNSIHKHCQPWIDDSNKKDPSVECLQAIYDSNGCVSVKQEKTDFTKSHNFKTLYLDSQWYFVKGCTETGIKQIEKPNESVMNMEDDLNIAIKHSKKNIMANENKIIINEIEIPRTTSLKVINSCLKIKDKAKDKIIIGSEDIKEGFSATKTSEDTKKYLNFNQYLLEITKGYNESIRNGNNKSIVDYVLHKDYNSFKTDGTVANIIGEKNIEEFENQIKLLTGVDVNQPMDVPRLTEGFDNGVSYDENRNLREHQGSNGDGSYLITALTKAKLLSIGQVYQLRKLMLEAFKVKSNRPFFHFYYENFGPVADMLVKENRLSEILPNMLKCIDLSKNGQFDLAFEQYLLTARQAYQICKDMGMDTKDLEDKFEQLDGTIDVLPEPNNLFVENGFREAITSF